METRTVTEGKIFYLVMNPVTDRAETGRITVMSDSKERLIQYYKDQSVPTYDDGNFRKVFRQGGPLEWYNPIWTFEGVDTFGHGLKEEWVQLSSLDTLKYKYLFI